MTLHDSFVARPVLAEETIFSGVIFDVVRREVDLGASGVVTRELVTHPGAVAVLALDQEQRVAMIRQYRAPAGAVMWELPAGLLDGGPEETLLGAARRELAEEVDLAAARWDVLVDYTTSPGFADEALRIFLARELSDAPAADFVREDEEAEIELIWVPLAQAVAAVGTGGIHSPSACLGLLAAARAAESGFTGLADVHAPFAPRPWVTPA